MARQRKRELPYAGTAVSIEKSRAQIAGLLRKYKIQASQWNELGNAMLLRFAIEHAGTVLWVRYMIDPARGTPAFARGWSAKDLAGLHEKESQRLHRVLFYVIKSKLECVEAGLESMLSVFMPQIELGGGTLLEQVEANLPALASHAGVTSVLALPAPQASRSGP